jgi:hypothetical protein
VELPPAGAPEAPYNNATSRRRRRIFPAEAGRLQVAGFTLFLYNEVRQQTQVGFFKKMFD